MGVLALQPRATTSRCQALSLAQTLGDRSRAVSLEGCRTHLAGVGRGARRGGRRVPTAIVAAGSDRGNELLAHVAALARPAVRRERHRGRRRRRHANPLRRHASLEEARLHGAPKILQRGSAHAARRAAAVPGRGAAHREPLDDGSPRASLETVAGVGPAGVSLRDAEGRRPAVIGRGVGSAEGFGIIEELAALLGAAVGCSRVVTSAGWRPHADQVGQTGTKISADLYVACGISSATQHIAGAKGAKKILAINDDADAPIFASAATTPSSATCTRSCPRSARS